MDELKYCVYIHTAPNGKKYIGITSRSTKARFKNGKGYIHNDYFNRTIIKYGWANIKHEIVYAGLTRESAIIEEKRLIALYDTTNIKNGFNLMTGGDGLGTHTQSTKEKLRELNIGKKWTDEQKEKQRILMTGHRLSEESKQMLRDKRVGKNNPFYGKKHSKESIDLIKEHANRPYGDKSANAKPVLMFDKDGNLLKRYTSISEAAQDNNINSPYNITASINGRQKSCGGYIWKYAV